jgi:hypothetical protein
LRKVVKRSENWAVVNDRTFSRPDKNIRQLRGHWSHEFDVKSGLAPHLAVTGIGDKILHFNLLFEEKWRQYQFWLFMSMGWNCVSELRLPTGLLFITYIYIYMSMEPGAVIFTGENPVPVPHCPPQIQHGLTRTRTGASVVSGQRLAACDMAWPTSPG